MKYLVTILVLMTSSLASANELATNLIRSTARITTFQQTGNTVTIDKGTGTVFARADLGSGEKYYILTNSHVISQDTVFVEFFRNGYVSTKIQADIEFRTNTKLNSHIDVGILSIPVKRIGIYHPEIVPLAPSGNKIKVGDSIFGASCPQEQEPMFWQSYVTSVTDELVDFKHSPLGGQSGTGVVTLIDGHPYISILLAWRVELKDGSKHGMGMNSALVWNTLRSNQQNTKESIDAKPIRIYRRIIPVVDTEVMSALAKVCKNCGSKLGKHVIVPSPTKRGFLRTTNGNRIHCPHPGHDYPITLDEVVKISDAFGKSLVSGFQAYREPPNPY